MKNPTLLKVVVLWLFSGGKPCHFTRLIAVTQNPCNPDSTLHLHKYSSSLGCTLPPLTTHWDLQYLTVLESVISVLQAWWSSVHYGGLHWPPRKHKWLEELVKPMLKVSVFKTASTKLTSSPFLSLRWQVVLCVPVSRVRLQPLLTTIFWTATQLIWWIHAGFITHLWTSPIISQFPLFWTWKWPY